jgi:hypothetical protein
MSFDFLYSGTWVDVVVNISLMLTMIFCAAVIFVAIAKFIVNTLLNVLFFIFFVIFIISSVTNIIINLF